MRVSTLAVAIFCGIVGATFMGNDALAAQALAKLTLNVAQNGYPNAEKCTLKNVAVRQEWFVNGWLCFQKLNYIDAVQCLGNKAAKTPAAISSGAKSRYDDFIVTQILQTMSIHGTVCFGLFRPRVGLTKSRATSSAGTDITFGLTSRR
jgi:tyrosinase